MNKKMGESEIQRKLILVADDQPEIRDILNELLTRAGYDVVQASNGEEALSTIKLEHPDLILLDINMPKMDGRGVKAELNKNIASANIPVIFVTGRDSSQDKIKGFNLGVDDYITKPFNLKELLARVDATLSRRKFYEEVSMTDGLTGILNRHYFDKQFRLFFNLAKRYEERSFSLAIIDIDRLKEINDTYGHPAGDFILKQFSSIMEETLRKTDVITRYGGDEFTILFPQNSEKKVMEAIERIRKEIRDKSFIYEDTGEKITFSISVGIAEYSDDFENETKMLECADKKMYKEKQGKHK